MVDIKANQERLGRAYEPKDSQFFVKHCKNLEEYEELESSLKDKREKSLLVMERRQLGFVTLSGNLATSGWVGLAYDR